MKLNTPYKLFLKLLILVSITHSSCSENKNKEKNQSNAAKKNEVNVKVNSIKNDTITKNEVINTSDKNIVIESNTNEIKEVQNIPKHTNTNYKLSPTKLKTTIKKTQQHQLQKAFSHESFDYLLQKYVSTDGKVNYKGFKAEHNKLKEYIESLAQNKPNNSASKNEKLAYWINVYNSNTINLILDNYPVKSITDIENGKPWDKKLVKILDKTYTLNEIENEIIRPIFKEPRIHFAVNCAAKSCPPLLNSAYTKNNIEILLEQQTKKFINNKTYNSIKKDNINISKIFDWYKSDFEINGTLIDFLNQYSNTRIPPTASVNFTEYDWSLNK